VFAAFPGGRTSTWRPDIEDEDGLLRLGKWEDRGLATENQSEWEFGGWSSDGVDDGGASVPCCKHLLACLLVDKWQGVLGGYVKERGPGIDEMAGIGYGG